jgi:transglutaminase-like putative cysteine protease
VKFKVTHTTEYLFSSDVFLEPHYLRLRPRETPHSYTSSFSLDITPQPEGLSYQFDEKGNLVHFCWFEGMTRRLFIQTTSTVISEEFNPLDFLLYPSDVFTVPFNYTDEQRSSLATSLAFDPISAPLLTYGEAILEASNFDTVTFLTNLTRQIHDDFIVDYRQFGEPYEPDTTYQLKTGSCRDLTWMQINLLRKMGIAARFVSGYFYFPSETPVFELHAWLEVFLPGAGWVGLDPSHGIAVSHGHIPIISSANFEQAMPVTGTIRGEATSILNTNVLIEAIN